METGLASSVENFYNSRWANFRFANRLKCIRAAAILDMLSKTRMVEPTILDVGSGAGWMTNILSMFGPSTGLELSSEAVATASVRYPHVKFAAGDIRTFQSETLFDIVVAQEVLEHFEVHQEFIDALARLTRIGGWIILTTPNARTLAAMPEEVRKSFQNQPVENPVCMSQLKRLVSSSFEVHSAASIVAGFGSRTISYRLANSHRLRAIWNRCFGAESAERLACRFGLGLHLVILAKRVK